LYHLIYSLAKVQTIHTVMIDHAVRLIYTQFYYYMEQI